MKTSFRDAMLNILNDDGKTPVFSFPAILKGFSICYEAVMKIRETLYEKKVFSIYNPPIPAISIGNLTTGGTGKTPMTALIARILRDNGLNVAVSGRGYKSKSEKAVGIVSNGGKILMDAESAGDEPFLLASSLEGVSVITGKDRQNACKIAAENLNADVIIMDDAYQRLNFFKHLNILLLDAKRPFGNGHVIPRGLLREGVSALKRADMIVMTRFDENINGSKSVESVLKKLSLFTPVFKAVHEPVLRKVLIPGSAEINPVKWCKKNKCRCHVFSGIADNVFFHDTIKNLGYRIGGVNAFPDHHHYNDKDITSIIRSAGSDDCFVTTEKDYVKIMGKASFPRPLFVYGIDMKIEDPSFFSIIKTSVGV